MLIQNQMINTSFATGIHLPFKWWNGERHGNDEDAGENENHATLIRFYVSNFKSFYNMICKKKKKKKKNRLYTQMILLSKLCDLHLDINICTVKLQTGASWISFTIKTLQKNMKITIENRNHGQTTCVISISSSPVV